MKLIPSTPSIGGSHGRVGLNPTTADAVRDRRANLSGAAVRRCPVCMGPTAEDSAFCSERHRSMFAEKVQRAAEDHGIQERRGRLGREVDPTGSIKREAIYRRQLRKRQKEKG